MRDHGARWHLGLLWDLLAGWRAINQARGERNSLPDSRAVRFLASTIGAGACKRPPRACVPQRRRSRITSTTMVRPSRTRKSSHQATAAKEMILPCLDRANWDHVFCLHQDGGEIRTKFNVNLCADPRVGQVQDAQDFLRPRRGIFSWPGIRK
jgi:hypothetical protein